MNTCAAQPYLFAGMERDEDQLDYDFARFYSWRQGRFMSGDPLGGNATDPQSLNRYTYAENNPINLTDPSGMKFKKACITFQLSCWSDLADGWDAGGGPGGGTWDQLFGSGYDPNSPWVFSFGDLQFGQDDPFGAFDGWGPSDIFSQLTNLGNLTCGDCADADDQYSFSSFSSVNNSFGYTSQQESACLAANIAQINKVSNLNVSPVNLANSPYMFNGGMNFDFSVSGVSPGALSPGRYSSSAFNLITGIGSSLHVTSPGGSDPSTYGIGPSGEFTFTTHIDSAYATWYTPLGALIHWIVDVRDKGTHRGPC